MKRTAFLLAAAAILGATLVAGVGAENTQTLTGEYVWNEGSRGKLEATFTADGRDRWDVAFRFVFRGKRWTYKGTAEGNLADGGLEGEVRNENKRRSFTFSGSFENGTFSGSHFETTGGRKERTGTLSLAR